MVIRKYWEELQYQINSRIIRLIGILYQIQGSKYIVIVLNYYINLIIYRYIILIMQPKSNK